MKLKHSMVELPLFLPWQLKKAISAMKIFVSKFGSNKQQLGRKSKW
jgi:hypothetical protein